MLVHPLIAVFPQLSPIFASAATQVTQVEIAKILGVRLSRSDLCLLSSLLLGFVFLRRGALPGFCLWNFLGSGKELPHVAWRIPGSKHVLKDRVRVCFGSRLSQRIFIVHPSIDDHLVLALEAIEQKI